MKFTGDLCRWLLGLGAEEPAEEMLGQDGNLDLDLKDRRQHAGSSCQERLASKEGLDEEERTRKRAEKRRAKKRRQKERRKQERAERMEDGAGQEGVEEVVAAASHGDRKEQLRWTGKSPQSLPARQRAQSGGNCRQPAGACSEEPEWDVSSAFVAKVANHIRLRGQRGGATVSSSREDKENEGSGSQGAEIKRRGEALTAKGIQLFGRSRYSHALAMFTEAIHCDPRDHRFYGNRSFCYLCLEQHQPALADALKSIQLAPDWPKGYFRKGCALMALKRYPEAEQALEQVLELDPRCKEAPMKLLRCRLLQLTALGVDEERSKGLLEKFTTVQAAVAAAEHGALRPPSLQDQSSCCSLWVGNVTVEVTRGDLWDLFQAFGEIKSIKVMHERFCAFVNFENASMAASALEMLKGVEMKGTRLVMRYPENWTQHTSLATKRQSQSVDEAASSSVASLPVF